MASGWKHRRALVQEGQERDAGFDDVDEKEGHEADDERGEDEQDVGGVLGPSGGVGHAGGRHGDGFIAAKGRGGGNAVGSGRASRRRRRS